MIKWIPLFIIGFILCNNSAQAEYTITLHNGQKQYEISPQHIEQLEDSTATYTIEQVSSRLFSSRFKASGQSMLRNTNRESAYWLKLNVVNKTDRSQQWLIESFNFRINEISCYIETNTGFTEVIQGDQYPFGQRSVGHKISNFYFQTPEKILPVICASEPNNPPALSYTCEGLMLSLRMQSGNTSC